MKKVSKPNSRKRWEEAVGVSCIKFERVFEDLEWHVFLLLQKVEHDLRKEGLSSYVVGRGEIIDEGQLR